MKRVRHITASRKVVGIDTKLKVKVTLEVTGLMATRPDFIDQTDCIESGVMAALGGQGFLLNHMRVK